MSSEKLEVHLNNVYDKDYKLTSTAKIWKGKALVSEWQTDEPRKLIHQGIEAAEKCVFTQIKMKKMLEKAATLFEAKIIIVEGK